MLQSGITAIAGVLIFAAQMRLWPNMFREYLLTLRLMFDWEHDFGFGPAGILAEPCGGANCLLLSPPPSCTSPSPACSAPPSCLCPPRPRMESSSDHLVPIAFVGVALLNPRIMKYDLAPLTVPMLLIAGAPCGLLSRAHPVKAMMAIPTRFETIAPRALLSWSQPSVF